MAHRLALAFVFLAALPALGGCSGGAENAPQSSSSGSAASTGQAPAPEPDEPDEPELLPFVKPTLADVDGKADWKSMPVVDAMNQLEEYLKQHAAPATFAEALAMKNDSAEANITIREAMGRLPQSPGDVNWDATISRHFLGDVKSTNSLLQSSVEEQEIYSFIGFGLFSFDWNLKPFAAAEYVKSWQSSADHMMDKVVMRDDLTWSDGRPLTAHDIEYSFNTILDERIPIPAVRAGTDKIRAVVAYDDHTLVFFHKKPLASNVWNLNFPIIPKHVFEKTIPQDFTLLKSPEHQKQDENPVCGGAYTISRRVRNQEIIVERRESYYMHNGKQVRRKPFFKTIRFTIVQDPNVALLALKKGDLDELQIMPEQWMTQTTDADFYRNNTKVRDVEWLYFYFGWNLKSPMFTDVRVRRALAYAMDYDEMLNKLAYGLYEPSNGIFHSTAWMYPKDAKPPFKQDLDKAEDLLDEADWTDHDGDGIRDHEVDGRSVKFEFTMFCAPVPLRLAICTLMKEQLEKIGILCHVQPVERTVMQQKLLDHDYQAVFAGWGTGADPSTLDNIFKTGEQRNFGYYANPEVDRLLKQAETEFDREKQAELYGKIHNIIFEDQPYTFLYYQSAFYAFNKELRGYRFSPRGPFHYSPGFSSIWRAAAH